MDIKTAFLNRNLTEDVYMTQPKGYLTEDVYMTQPKGFVDHKYAGKICKLQKSIYELKQVSQRWNLHFDEVVKGFGFIKNVEEPCVYKKVSGSTLVFLVLYVDDILLIRNDISMMGVVKSSLRKSFSINDLGEVAHILGIKIYRDRSKRLIRLRQDAYIDKILNRFNMQDSKKGFLLMLHGITLNKEQCPTDPDEQERMIAISYASAIRSIMYAMIYTRSNVFYALSATSRYQSNYGDAHWMIIKNILKYLRRTNEAFLVFGGVEELVVKGYNDASFQTDTDDSKSQSDFVFYLN
jgi:hypothetical protein